MLSHKGQRKTAATGEGALLSLGREGASRAEVLAGKGRLGRGRRKPNSCMVTS